MLHEPSIIFLDEYTSGLDSPTAASITQLLHGLAATGRVIVATLHQPSSNIFFSFDKLCLLAQGQYVGCLQAQ
jgi:ATP-binding cassette subfamily G (WHITE) protein 1